VLKLAGLDVDALLKISGYTPGIGGPFVALSQDHHPSSEFPQEGAAAVSSGVTVLESKLSRMAALNDLMRCVPLISPVDNYQLTSPFGKRKDPITGQPAFHKGIDIGGWAGIKVHATAAGTVTYAGRKGGYGYMVKVDHGCGIQTLYAHLKRIKVNKGQEIDHRTVIGTLGSSGRSTGPHVHYEVIVDGKVYNPAAFIEAGRHVHKI
jgi:murein DD-endopeptidase MepM/ murein hydrolase activator NlpD